MRVIAPAAQVAESDALRRLNMFDRATVREQRRQSRRKLQSATDRGWTRDELYDRRVVAVVTRVRGSDQRPLLNPDDARQEAEEFLSQFRVLDPDEALVRIALRGAAAYCRLAGFDAHLWAYAEHYRVDELYSEDFRIDRLYGSVRIVNRFSETTNPPQP